MLLWLVILSRNLRLGTHSGWKITLYPKEFHCVSSGCLDNIMRAINTLRNTPSCLLVENVATISG